MLFFWDTVYLFKTTNLTFRKQKLQEHDTQRKQLNSKCPV